MVAKRKWALKQMFDPKAKATKFQVGDWLQCQFDWAEFKAGELVGEVTKVGQTFEDTGVYSVWLMLAAQPGQDEQDRRVVCTPAEYCTFLGFPVTTGELFDEFINQGLRECEVLEVKHTRFRIAFSMPNCEQEGWRDGVRVPGCPHLFYPFGHLRMVPEDPFPFDLEEFIRSRTGFESLEDMLTRPGGYRPTIHVHEDPQLLKLADAYDRAQAQRGDPRRAYRGE